MRGFRSLLLSLILALVPAFALAQDEFDTKAKFAILMDYESGSLLYHKNADAPMEPA